MVSTHLHYALNTSHYMLVLRLLIVRTTSDVCHHL